MGRTILCPHCKSTFDENVLAKRVDPNKCPVCGEGLLGENNSSEIVKEKTKWYYYKEGGGTLTTTLSSSFTPLYTFEAVDLKDAECQLKEVLPSSPLVNDSTPDKVKCPYCFSSEIQIIPRKFSLLAGFATNKFERVCVRCKRKF
ncbi:hypothetical protein NSB25_26810 [Acetatifactor muris]|uniref:Uncharacterized protein n=1 Tax=Acetatifactor muris TaxID=879566 RepID=A0A2K4ZPK1_9FIRM|nr:hypothetical protein [Acetatifactor muris]MCR2050845.1 hypothetical protein [Acetatifactor muris]SOY32389.1 hypothetical protein AMURIS_05148 [Acetatifactor muris]